MREGLLERINREYWMRGWSLQELREKEREWWRSTVYTDGWCQSFVDCRPEVFCATVLHWLEFVCRATVLITALSNPRITTALPQQFIYHCFFGTAVALVCNIAVFFLLHQSAWHCYWLQCLHSRFCTFFKRLFLYGIEIKVNFLLFLFLLKYLLTSKIYFLSLLNHMFIVYGKTLS